MQHEILDWCIVWGMNEQVDVISRIQAGGILDGIHWAYTSAVSRTLADYSEDAGYDAAWLGNTRFTLFRDRLDRVFSCGKYALQANDDSTAGLDLVQVELTERDIETMPTISPNRVRRADLNHSPGWLFEDVRFLLASCEFGKVEVLPWPQKSPTKQQVAKRSNPDPQPTLFDRFADDELAHTVAPVDETFDVDTFVVAHTLDAVSQKRELVFGRPRLNEGGGEAWHWFENLLTGPIPPGDQQDVPKLTGLDSVPDAPVRLRRKAERGNVAGGAA